MTAFDASKIQQSYQNFRAGVSEFSENHPKASSTLGGLAFGLIYLYGLPNLAEAASNPALMRVDQFVGNINLPWLHNSIVPLGRETLEGLRYLMHVMSSGIVTGDAPSTTGKLLEFSSTIATLGGIGAQLGKFASASIKDLWDSTFNRSQRMLFGTEPLLDKEAPSHVIIGDSTIISDISKNIVLNKHKNRPIVGIHPDGGTPPAWGSNIHYHFHTQPHELTDTFTQSNSSISYIHAVGLDRTDEITVACIDPDNSLFYGNDAKPSIRPSFVSTLLNKITEKDINALKGKKVNVIMNETPQLGGVKTLQHDLEVVGQLGSFEPKVISPETLAIDLIKNKVIEVLDKRSGQSKDPIRIALVGEGNEEKDKKMLQRFKSAIAGISISSNDVVFDISLVEDRELDGMVIDGQTVTREQQDEKLQSKLNISDLVFVYGDHDDGTSSLVNNALHSGALKEKIHAFIERPSSISDVGRYLDESNVHCIYNMVMDAYLPTQTTN